MEQPLKDDVHSTLTELIGLFSSIDEKQVNIIPFKGSWTAGQLAQHMVLSNGGFLETMNGPARDTRRKPDEKIPDIKSTFLNFSIRFESPDFVRPAMIDYDKDDLLNALRSIRDGLDHVLETSDLTKTCTSFELPVLGYLTRLEAAHFVLYHTQRHIHQLTNIVSKLASSRNVAVN